MYRFAMAFLVSSLLTTAAVAASPSANLSYENLILREVHAINQAEIDAGKVALRRAHDNATKRFAQTMIDDHQRLDVQLQSLARDENLNLTPPHPSAELKAFRGRQLQLVEHLDRPNALHFDQTFVDDMAASHKDAIRLANDAMHNITDKRTNAYLSEWLPVLEKHLNAAGHLRAVSH